jgi:hypothetical protein
MWANKWWYALQEFKFNLRTKKLIYKEKEDKLAWLGAKCVRGNQKKTQWMWAELYRSWVISWRERAFVTQEEIKRILKWRNCLCLDKSLGQVSTSHSRWKFLCGQVCCLLLWKIFMSSPKNA